LKIAVTNAVLSNTGDAAIYEAILRSFDDAGVAEPHEVIVFDANAAVTARLYPEWTVYQQLTVSPPRKIARVRGQLQKIRLRLCDALLADSKLLGRALRSPLFSRTRFAKAYEALITCDVVVSSGGTYLVDHYNFGPRVTELQLAKKHHSAVVLWTQSLGPFKSDRARKAITEIAKVVDGVFFRDERSRDSWAGVVPMPELNRVVPDVVFALRGGVLESAKPAAAAGAKKSRALISVRDWAHGVDSGELSYAAYERMFQHGASRLVNDGWHVECLSTCQGVPSYAHDDSKVAARIFSGIAVDVNDAFHTPQGLLHELDTADLVITTRMHLAILALISQRPVIAIAYEFKTLELFNSLGLGRFVIRIEDANDAWIAERITELQADPSSAVLSDDALAALRDSAVGPAFELADQLDRLVSVAKSVR
jgi:colanic acid/amylovoran biosynthesis protein